MSASISDLVREHSWCPYPYYPSVPSKPEATAKPPTLDAAAKRLRKAEKRLKDLKNRARKLADETATNGTERGAAGIELERAREQFRIAALDNARTKYGVDEKAGFR